MRNIRLIIAYDGGTYFGWQKTSTGPSIQQELESAILRILGESTTAEAASRTDRGVHAQGQAVQFLTAQTTELGRIKLGLNAVLPREISIQSIEEMPLDFHPTLDTSGKEYHYFICNSAIQMPTHRHYSWHLHQPLDLPAMENATEQLLGQRDFASLSNELIDNTVRTLEKLSIIPMENQRCRIEIRGDNFLYKMARNIVGALVATGLGKITPTDLPSILQSRDRKKAPVTAPAHGLFLWEVFYPKESLCS
jgi:tRNA pseudouridine38-40 synthase